jgi:hypothetical protein
MKAIPACRIPGIFLRPLLLAAAFLAWAAPGCEKSGDRHTGALASLLSNYANGEITECMHKGSKVYSASQNVFDAETRIYDRDGKEVGTCFFSTGTVDAICNELKDCETVYRCRNHISGQPPVDKYDLTR